MRRMFRIMRRRNARSPASEQHPAGVYAIAFGVRVGYWPCLKAPYVQLAFMTWLVDIWHGFPSYKQLGDK